MTREIEIFEVGPRDGLQNEATFIAPKDKIDLINALAVAGLPRIEIASFVSPKWVPQMAHGDLVALGATRLDSKFYALVPNAKGLEQANHSQLDGLCVFIAASEGFSRANTNISVVDGLARAVGLIKSIPSGIAVRGYISCITDCPFDGRVDPDVVAGLAEELVHAGCHEVSLGDTLGRARPEQVDDVLTAVLAGVPATVVAGHYHDTAGRALDNIDVSLAHGVSIFDASIAGLGGCPYAPGAQGNVATEKVYDHLIANGYSIKGAPDRSSLAEAAMIARKLVGKHDAKL